MKLINLIFLALMMLTFPLLSNAATYNYYFSDDATGNAQGNDGNSCLDGTTNACKTLSKAQGLVDAANSDDTVNLYFDKSDTWTYNSAAVSPTEVYGIRVDSTDPIVNMDAYGSGDNPIFDGLVTDFSAVPVHDSTDGPKLWNSFFRFDRYDCSISNIEIKRVYGSAIVTRGADGFTLSNSSIHDFGGSGINSHTSTGYTMRNSLVEYNTMHTGQQLWRYEKRPAGWGAAIGWGGGNSYDNLIRYNLIYDIYGEGVINPGGITEYNVFGDTYSVAIYGSPHAPIDTHDTTIRYNYVMSSSSATYRVIDGRTAYHGIGVIDERDDEAGSNANADIEIYGNIVINRKMGIYAKNANVATNDAFKSIKIYNNLVIDCSFYNYYISNPEGYDAGYIYNNSSILYDRTTSTHTNDSLDAGWDVDNNHFWTTGGSPVVKSGWQSNYVTTDPRLSGEPSVDWDGQSGATYWNNIDFVKHLCLSSDSALVNSGKTLGAGYEETYLSYGTDFDTVPDTNTFYFQEQTSEGDWDIGPIVHDYNAGAAIPKPPTDLGIKIN